jgi:energy-converting hydrogenase A subunit B
MIDLLAAIPIAAVICLVLFTALDIFWKLPKQGGVSGADVIGKELEKNGGDLNGGWMIGNIISSPDASTGTIFAACSYYVWGIWGALIAIVLVYIGEHICADKGFAGVSGVVCATLIIWLLTSFAGFPPESFIAGCVIAIFLVEGISPKHASRLLGKIWRKVS